VCLQHEGGFAEDCVLAALMRFASFVCIYFSGRLESGDIDLFIYTRRVYGNTTLFLVTSVYFAGLDGMHGWCFWGCFGGG